MGMQRPDLTDLGNRARSVPHLVTTNLIQAFCGRFHRSRAVF